MQGTCDISSLMGLSPRVRGNPAAVNVSASSSGSIPACAGEPEGNRGCKTDNKVYPRVCGGTAAANNRVRACAGLSPRVRGNHRLAEQGGISKGSIPACAGEPSSRGS